VTWVLVYRTEKYQKLKLEIEKQSKKLEKKKEAQGETSVMDRSKKKKLEQVGIYAFHEICFVSLTNFRGTNRYKKKINYQCFGFLFTGSGSSILGRINEYRSGSREMDPCGFDDQKLEKNKYIFSVLRIRIH
jgi:hypothetical protein